jgi:SAM-dependent methyltransferase
MRLAGEDYLADWPRFSMVDGSAEATTLANASVDFVVAGQAFHWFRPQEARAEFARILKPEAWAVLIWHDRNVEATPFLRALEDFIRRHSNDYDQVSHKWVATYNALEQFFAPNKMSLIQQQNQQRLDLDGLRGRLLSASYMPKSGAHYEALSRELPELFSSYAADGEVVVQYETKIYYGHLSR